MLKWSYWFLLFIFIILINACSVTIETGGKAEKFTRKNYSTDSIIVFGNYNSGLSVPDAENTRVRLQVNSPLFEPINSSYDLYMIYAKDKVHEMGGNVIAVNKVIHDSKFRITVDTYHVKPEVYGRLSLERDSVMKTYNGMLSNSYQIHPEDLKFKKNLSIDSFPYKDIAILDNRLDTVRFGTNAGHNYPPQYFMFEFPFRKMLKMYIERRTALIPKVQKSLLINVKECRFTNTSRELIFEADVYVKRDSTHYSKFLTVTQKGDIAHLSLYLDHLIEAASFPDAAAEPMKFLKQTKGHRLSYLHRESFSYKYVLPGTLYTLDSINLPYNEDWRSSPIMKAEKYEMGIYANFNDFRENHVKPKNVELKNFGGGYALKDLPENKMSDKFPWAVSDGKNLYVMLWGRYLQLKKDSGCFHFIIPNDMPNMYKLTSLYAAYNTQYIANQSSSGNLGVDLAAGLTTAIINASVQKHQENAILEETHNAEFRDCIIDLYSGDFVYY